MDNIKQRIMLIMKQLGFSKMEMAKKLEVPYTTFSDSLTDKRSLSLDTVAKLLVAFPDVSAEWLLRGHGSMKKSEIESDLESKYKRLEIELAYATRVLTGYRDAVNRK